MEKIKYYGRDAITIFIGNLILAFAVSFFYLPNNVLAGGVAGVSIALYPIFKIKVEVMMNLLVIGSYFLGWIFLGKKFAIKTLGSAMLYPIFITMFSHFHFNPVIDPILASIFGGVIGGFGLGLTFRTGASTGGMDIPPLILAKYTPFKVSFWIIIVDTITVFLGLKSYGLNSVLTGLISIVTTTYAVDRVMMLGGEQAKQVFIISEFNDEILEKIHTTISRGSTLIQSRGGYTKLGREIIMTVLLRRQYNELEKIVKEIDPGAFLIVSDVTEVHGQGFYKV